MDSKPPLPTSLQNPDRPKLVSRRLRLAAVATGIFTVWLLFTRVLEFHIQFKTFQATESSLPTRYSCRPFLPSNLLQLHPPRHDDQAFWLPKLQLELAIRGTFNPVTTDNLVLGIVGPTEVIWWRGYGRAQANGTNFRAPNEHTIYRIASISKLFATLEGFILRDKGAINWDDPVQKYLANFTYNHQGWAEYITKRSLDSSIHERSDVITLRQLASHMSGVGRDLPPRNLDSWPDLPKPPPRPAKLPSLEDQLDSIAELPLVAPPYTFPSYSNTGFSVLGASLAVAASKDSEKNVTYAQLLKRDVFDPLGMDGSSFTVSEQNRERLAIPRDGREIDIYFPDAFNAAGGQYSSFSDLSKTVHYLLSPNASLLSRASKREWFRPMHIHPDTSTETGLTWEIFKISDSYKRDMRYYTKGGSFRYTRSQILFNPQLQFGSVILLNGPAVDPGQFSRLVVKFFQPVFEKLLEQRTEERYAGKWMGGEGNEIELEVKEGTLWITKWVVNGRDFLGLYGGQWFRRLALWNTGRLDEFRIAIGHAGPLDDVYGCFTSWGLFDVMQSHHAPIDLVYFGDQENERVLHFPSGNVTLHRV